NRGASFVHGGCEFIDGAGNVLFTHRPKPSNAIRLRDKLERAVAWPASFLRRSVVEAVGDVNRYGNDLDYLIRIGFRYPLHNIDTVLSCFRIHQESETGSIEKYLRVLRDDFTV